jgi:beta-phosphoglucomutase-like phosphatase (HAD superfamily)
VLEDSRLGVAAARSAGMACIALPEPGVSAPEAFSSADLVVPGGASNLNVEHVLRLYDWVPRQSPEA